MNIKDQIKSYIDSQSEIKRSDMQVLHKLIINQWPKCKLWFLDGKDEKGKVVSNPNIGYGCYAINYANGTNKEFYQIGLSANTTGISVYILGIANKTYLEHTFGGKIGKAKVTGYCIKFKSLNDINTDVLIDSINYGLAQSTN